MSSDYKLRYLIALDAGNSRLKMGAFAVTNTQTLPECLELIAFDNKSLESEETAQFRIREFLLKYVESSFEAILAGSNLEAIQRVRALWPQDVCQLYVKEDRQDLPLKIMVDFPEKVGMDRLLNALAIRKIKPKDHLGVIIDTGTATTVDVVDQQGDFAGGAILPGLRLSALALHHYTSLLPHVDVNLLTEMPLRVIGKNTHEAILNGILWGHLGAIHELVRRYAQTFKEPVSCYITGGAAPLLLPHLEQDIMHYPNLALQGLAIWHLLTTSGNTF